MRLRRLRALWAAVLAVLLTAGAASAQDVPDPGDAAQGGAVLEIDDLDATPRFWEAGGTIDEAFGKAMTWVEYVPFYNLLGGPNVEPLKDDAGNPILGPDAGEVKIQLPFVVVWLVVAAIFFTVAWRFANFRLFGHAIAVVRGKYDNPSDHGEVTHFQALSSALSATVGLGNIAGVAIAISMGGPGATFWMILAGLLGMSLKFTECTLGQKFRHIDEHGHVSGGPMRYLRDGLQQRGLGALGAVLSVMFIVFCIGGSLAGGNSFQVNQSLGILRTEMPFFAEHGWAYGVIMAAGVGVVIIGGIKRIAQTAEKIVPMMCGIYLLAGLLVIVGHLEEVPAAIGEIIGGAFAPDAMYGGAIGTLVLGFKRAAFSNEAGVGSAAIAHSAAKTEYPVREGIVALLEPFIDTVMICTMTALVIVITGVYDPAGPHSEFVATSQGAALTREAFRSVDLLGVGTWFPWVLMIAVVLFAYSTMISWSYYGERCWTTLFGERSSLSYKALFLVFVVLGSIVSAENVLAFGDLMILIMAFPNILGLYLLRGVVSKELNEYEAKMRAGELRVYK
jgi:AGCS family alanine or glycine:cation symporter